MHFEIVYNVHYLSLFQFLDSQLKKLLKSKYLQYSNAFQNLMLLKQLPLIF